MLYFINDYSEGAAAEILDKMLESNLSKQSGYGSDEFCLSAKEKIKKALNADAEIFFVSGGTQANKIVIASILKNYEGVIAADTGHISVHEAGAIENTGHKVIGLKSKNGKIDADAVRKFCSEFYADVNHEHMVYPGMVYLSQPTEYGSIYSKKEIESISEICKEYKMPLFIDGARLAYALGSCECDTDLADIAGLCDVFYIGGTKCGALIGEAIVFTNKELCKHFFTNMKLFGGVLAKGRLLGIQFDTLFTDNLYKRLGKSGVDAAMKIKKALLQKGYELYIDSPTNQQFIVVDDALRERLSKDVAFGFMETLENGKHVIRFCTSWATKDEDVERLIDVL
nr:aminotransferase class V-fold PLP-dependent enzyme [uncultured Lachnoanaerobaculum sp.]